MWASGNGGKKQDNCNCDGYVSSPYTLAVGSVSELGEFPWYGEKCAATMAVTYSSGAYTDQKIVSNPECTFLSFFCSFADPSSDAREMPLDPSALDKDCNGIFYLIYPEAHCLVVVLTVFTIERILRDWSLF